MSEEPKKSTTMREEPNAAAEAAYDKAWATYAKAQTTFDKGTITQREAREKAIVEAWAAFDKATITEQEARKKTNKEAREAYAKDIAAARADESDFVAGNIYTAFLGAHYAHEGRSKERGQG